ncbi:MAG: ATP-binding protein [Verrucomicrobiae bacterium]|nr:ATP-binding protein [Verrucomicrobiae bacterium]
MSDRIVLSPARTPVAEPPEEPRPRPAPDGAKVFEGINIGGHTVTESTEHLPEDQRLLVRWLHHHAREQRWTWDQLVAAVGYSSTTWSRIFRDKYRYAEGEARSGERMPVTDQCQAIARYKATWEARQAVTQTGFIETSIWRWVDAICRRAFVRQKIAMIFGASQIGKSECVRERQRRNNHGQTTYAEMPPASGVQLMLRTIAEALMVPSHAGFDKLLANVCKALDGSKLLIVDEIHRVFTTYQRGSVMRCLDTLRYIHDQTRCGMVLVGTNVMRDQLRRGEFSLYLEQFRRRARTMILQLPSSPPREDLDLMSEAFGLPPATGDAERVLLEEAKANGFGAVKMLLQDASERAHKRRRPIAWDDFVWAHGFAMKMTLEDGEVRP